MLRSSLITLILVGALPAWAEPPPLEGSPAAEMAKLERRFEEMMVLASRKPGVVAAEEAFWGAVRASVKDPEVVTKIDRFRALNEKGWKAMRSGRQDDLSALAKEMGELGPSVEQAKEEAMARDPEVRKKAAAAQDALQQQLESEPEYHAILERGEQLQLEIAALAGELRRAPKGKAPTLASAREGFVTKVFASADRTPAPKPPPEIFQKVTYAAPLGPQVAYVSPATKGARRPAIVWIAGGFDWGIGSIFWEPAPRANDQTAAAFREAGIVLMLPSLRGANENPGKSECMLGEVDDIIAAVKYLEGRKDVDPKRIYLGGHSTGGTLALLAAEKAARFRAVFSFGPIDNPRGYGEICGTQGLLEEEAYVRAPIEFAEHITSPTWVIEGADGNTRAGKAIAIFAKDNLRFIEVPGADHFTVLRPGSEAVARAILADKEPDMNLRIEAADIKAAMTRSPR